MELEVVVPGGGDGSDGSEFVELLAGDVRQEFFVEAVTGRAKIGVSLPESNAEVICSGFPT